MSEEYTIGGDSYQLIREAKIGGQTFRTEKDFNLEYVDLNLRLGSFMTEPGVFIYLADWDGFPFGDCLSRNKWMIYPYKITNVNRRVRFPMGFLKIVPWLDYCLIVRCSPSIIEPSTYWLYDSGDATYPRGKRIHSDDGGATWTADENDDHIFCIFGIPAPPPPPPPPPIDIWAIIDINYQRTTTGTKVIVTTDTPVHLYMRWSHEEPDIHLVPVRRRGAVVGTRTKYCFDVYEDNEQVEDGDTTYHTFIKEPWEDCETRYFYFWGLIDGWHTDSESALFQYHRKAPVLVCSSTQMGTDNGWLYKHQQRAQTIIFPSYVNPQLIEISLKKFAAEHIDGVHIEIQGATDGHLPDGNVYSYGYISLPTPMPNVWTKYSCGMTGCQLNKDKEYMWIMRPDPWEAGVPYDEVHVERGTAFTCGWPGYEASKDYGENWMLSAPSAKRTFMNFYAKG